MKALRRPGLARLRRSGSARREYMAHPGWLRQALRLVARLERQEEAAITGEDWAEANRLGMLQHRLYDGAWLARTVDARGVVRWGLR